MIQNITEKFVQISKKKPFSSAVNHYIGETCRIDWIGSNLQLEGSGVTKTQIASIVRGELVKEINVGDYALIHSYWKLFSYMDDLLDMETELSESVLQKLYDHLFPQNEGYRTGNPILRQWNYNPPHYKDVEEQVHVLFHWYGTATYPGNPLMKATVLHNQLLKIYPFGEDSCIMARLALLYHLMDKGLYPFTLNISEQEYNDGMQVYLKKEESTALYHAVERGVYNRLEILWQMIKEEDAEMEDER